MADASCVGEINNHSEDAVTDNGVEEVTSHVLNATVNLGEAVDPELLRLFLNSLER